MDHGSDFAGGEPNWSARPENAPRSRSRITNPETATPSALELEYRKAKSAGFYKGDPGKFHVVERHTSAIMITEDMAAQILYCWDNRINMPQHLYNIIMWGIHYHGNLKDNEALWALHRLSAFHKREVPQIYLVLGLYLYLADSASRFPNNPDNPDLSVTVLQSFRHQGFELESSVEAAPVYIREDLKEKMLNVLKELKLDTPHFRQVIEDFYTKGSFHLEDGDIGGDLNMQPEKGLSLGTYVIYAATLCSLNPNNPLAQLSTAISAALGNKEAMSKLPRVHDDGLANCQAIIKIMHNREKIQKIVDKGNELRFIKFIDQIRKQFPNAARRASDIETQEIMDLAIEGLPQEIGIPLLQVQEREGKAIYFLNDLFVRPSYPDQDLPGCSHDECEASRDSAGVNIPRYHAILIARGKVVTEKIREYESPEDLKQTEIVRMRQISAHELFHNLLGAASVIANQHMSGKGAKPNDGHLPGSTIRNMKERAYNICERLDKLKEKSPEIYAKFFGDIFLASPADNKGFITIGNVLSHRQPSGWSYSQINWQEEIWANIVGLMSGQCSKDLRKENNAFWGEVNQDDPKVINDLRRFCEETRALIPKMRDVACENITRVNFSSAFKTAPRQFNSLRSPSSLSPAA